MRRVITRLLVALAVGALIGSCGSDDAASDTQPEPAAAATEPAAAATEPAATEPELAEAEPEPAEAEPEPAEAEGTSASTLADACTVLEGPEVARFFADATAIGLGTPSEAARFEQAGSCGYLSAANEQHGLVVTIAYDSAPDVAASEIEKYAGNAPLAGDFDAGFVFTGSGDPVEIGSYAHSDGTLAIIRWFVPAGTPAPDDLDLAQYLRNVLERATT